MNNIIIVGIGSMLGGISRHLLSGYIQRHIHTAFPLGILIVNVAGCFLIGFVAGVFAHTNLFSHSHRLFLSVGFCGGFTTFSSFSLDNLQFLTTRAYILFSLNIGLSVATGLLATWAGYQLAQSFSK